MAYPINRTLMDSLEAVFLTQARSLLKEIAKEVGKPEKQLLAAFEKEKIGLCVIDREDENYEGCMALCTGCSLAKRCREPVYDGTSYCPLHLRLHVTGEDPHPSKPKLQRVQTETGDVYFLDTLTQSLYTETYERCGFCRDGKFTVFKLEMISEE